MARTSLTDPANVKNIFKNVLHALGNSVTSHSAIQLRGKVKHYVKKQPGAAQDVIFPYPSICKWFVSSAGPVDQMLNKLVNRTVGQVLLRPVRGAQVVGNWEPAHDRYPRNQEVEGGSTESGAYGSGAYIVSV
jgi:hypothetical protein